MGKIVGALVCRNEAAPDRYLRLAVENALSYCDSVVCVDDSSTDDTVGVLSEYPRVEIVSLRGAQSAGEGFWGHDEATPRARLWVEAAKRAGPDGWIWVFDADHELVGLSPADLRACCRSEIVNAWAFPLWDCWDSPNTMRVDGYWQAHKHPRPWLFKAHPTPDFIPDWTRIDRKGVHTGHCPPNYPLRVATLPGAAIKHHGYIRASHRAIKHAKYLAL